MTLFELKNLRSVDSFHRRLEMRERLTL